MAERVVKTQLEIDYEQLRVTEHDRTQLARELAPLVENPMANIFTPYVKLVRDSKGFHFELRGYGRTDILLVQFYSKPDENERCEHIANVFVEADGSKQMDVATCVVVDQTEERRMLAEAQKVLDSEQYSDHVRKQRQWFTAKPWIELEGKDVKEGIAILTTNGW